MALIGPRHISTYTPRFVSFEGFPRSKRSIGASSTLQRIRRTPRLELVRARDTELIYLQLLGRPARSAFSITELRVGLIFPAGQVNFTWLVLIEFLISTSRISTDRESGSVQLLDRGSNCEILSPTGGGCKLRAKVLGPRFYAISSFFFPFRDRKRPSNLTRVEKYRARVPLHCARRHVSRNFLSLAASRTLNFSFPLLSVSLIYFFL